MQDMCSSIILPLLLIPHSQVRIESLLPFGTYSFTFLLPLAGQVNWVLESHPSDSSPVTSDQISICLQDPLLFASLCRNRTEFTKLHKYHSPTTSIQYVHQSFWFPQKKEMAFKNIHCAHKTTLAVIHTNFTSVLF